MLLNKYMFKLQLGEICLSQAHAKLWMKETYFLIYGSLNSLQPGVAFLYPLNTSENLKSDVFRGYRKKHRVEMG